MPPHHSPKFQGWFFYALKHYLINVKTNVSNAKMNIPKAIRSLKSNGFLSISTTPILCRIEVSHPATRLFLSIYYHKRGQHTISISVSPGPRQIAELVGQRSHLTTVEVSAFYHFPGPPDRLSCCRIVIPFMVLHQIYPNSSSAHLRTFLSTSLVHVSLNRRTPT